MVFGRVGKQLLRERHNLPAAADHAGKSCRVGPQAELSYPRRYSPSVRLQADPRLRLPVKYSFPSSLLHAYDSHASGPLAAIISPVKRSV